MFLPLAARSFDTIDLFFGEAVVVAEIVRWRAVTVVAWHIGTRQLHGRSSRTAIGPGGGGRDAMYVFGAIVEHVNSCFARLISSNPRFGRINDTACGERHFFKVFWDRDIVVNMIIF
jgi:hypothetical protein